MPGEVHGRVITWGPCANGDVGLPVDLTQYADRSVQVEGTLGAGGQCTMEGSNDGVNYRVLHDPFSVALTVNATGISHITEMTRLMRPRITGGDGTTAMMVTLFARKPVR
jgi:hypothetical protein